MGQQFEYKMDNVVFDTQKRIVCRLAPLADIFLIAETLSNRIGSLRLCIRFRTMHDVNFSQIDVPAKIFRKDFPEGYDPSDPAKLLARCITLQIKSNGRYVLECGAYKASGRIQTSLDPFLEITPAPEDEKRVYTREDVDEERTCIPPV
jgi:hypothetical protein